VGSGLIEALTAESPCGEDLEDTQLLASFDAYRLFGQSAPLSADTDWREIRDRSLEALGTSKDLRLLTCLACARVRIDGVAGYAESLGTAAHWLENWWAECFPRVDEDAILRRNALNGFADHFGVVDGLRRAPLLKHPQLGALSIRDIEIATGHAKAGAEETPADEAQVNALLAASSVEALGAISTTLGGLLQNFKSIDAAMRNAGGDQAAPDFDALKGPIARTAKLVADHLATRVPTGGEAGAGAAAGAASGGAIGSIRSREDAMRALDAVAAFFRSTEPSSPVPLFVERAKRLVAKDFFAVLEDIAPDALAQAKSAGGVRDQ
jgi:type VI secretion system protein ImpA